MALCCHPGKELSQVQPGGGGGGGIFSSFSFPFHFEYVLFFISFSEFCSGGSLYDVLNDKERKIEFSEKQNWALGITEGVPATCITM